MPVTTRSQKRRRNTNKKSLKVKGDVKLKSKPTFAMRLAAFILQGVKTPIFFSKTGGFSGLHDEVFGVLPLLHMNIQEATFVKMLNGASGNFHRAIKSACNSKNLNKKLSKVDFSCDKQSKSAVTAINKGIIASVNNRYGIRQNGQRRLSEILRIQTWQHQNGIIPSSSLNYNN